MGYLTKSSDKAKSSQNNALGTVADMPIQAKMRYGQPGDSYEQEADRVADSVVNNTSSKSSNAAVSPALGNSISNYVQREPGGEVKDEEKTQKKEEKKEEEKPAQKKEEKKEQEKPTQKKEAKKEEEKPVQKKEAKKEEEKPAQKKEAKKEEEKPAQKKEAKKEEEKPAQKKEAKKEEEKPVQKKETKKEEEKPAQKKEDKKEEEKPVQKKSTDKKEEEKKVQKKEAKKDEEKPAQKKESDNPKVEEPDIEKDIIASKNAGKPMEDDVRKEMEQQFSKNFKNVRIHNDPMSYEMCRKINAQAFTHGSHIYFAEGKYNPQNTEGKRLLAHELTHVVQQGNEVKRKMIQKTGESGGASDNESTVENEYKKTGVGRVKKDSGGQVIEMELPSLKVPGLKLPHSPTSGQSLPRRTGEDRPSDQIAVWESNINLNAAASQALNTKLNTAIASYQRLNQLLNGRRIFFLKKKGSRDQGGTTKGIIMGSESDVLQKMKRPQWAPDGRPLPFDVDHQKELQIGGAHNINNMWLLASFQNQASGRNIKDSLNEQINTLRTSARGALGTLPSAQDIRRSVDIVLTGGSVSDPSMDPKTDAIKYTKDEVESGAQIEGLEYLSEQAIIDNNLAGSESKLAVYSSQSGGNKVDVDFDPAQTGTALPVNKTFGNLKINTVTYLGQNATNSVNIKLFEGFTRHLKRPVQFTADLNPSDAVAYGGVLSKQSVLAQLRSNPVDLKYASPIQINDLEMTDFGLQARGKLLPSIPPIQRADIDVLINEDGLVISKTFDSGELQVPAPLQISNASLSIFLSSERGFGIQGQVDFKINNVGEGFVRGAVSTGNSVELEGEFNFDSRLFQPARIRVTYREEQWTVTGQLGIPQGKVRGIKRGNITVTYANETLTAQGDVEPDIKGIQRGSMNAVFNEAGFLISGDFTLSNEIPGIRGGQLRASLEKTGDEYKVRASGTAQPAIPGIDTTLSIEYDNGALKIEGSAAYQRGLLSGNIRVGATNRAVGADGQPSGDPTDTFTVYGGGELTVRITPWLQGTIGVNFLPNGEMEVSGRIGIPSPIDVFPRKEIPERDIFSIGIDIPIFAIPLGPRSIGLKATIGGALKVYAGIGPGRLEQLELGITYNPDRPDDAHVTGTGRFVVPADAGLKLAVRASVGIDAGVAGVEGGFEVAGGLGLSATAAAAVSIDWTPNTGLELNATLSADVQPKFIFNVDGFVKAWVLFWENEWRWRLANYEYGSNLNFGVSLPVHYKEGEAFDLSMDQIEFRKPDIDANSFIGGLLGGLM
jgi:hypothetical protein